MGMNSEQRVINATVAEDGVRLDRWLAGRFTYRSRNQWQELVADGKILVDGHVRRSSKLLMSGDVVSFVPDAEEPEVDFNYSVVHEDEWLLAVDKPGNLPCHPAGPYFRNTLWAALGGTSGRKIHGVNRLDRETSGLTLFGKDPATAARLSGMFMTKEVEKEYLLLVHGDFPESMDADGHLSPDPASAIRKKRRFTSAPLPGSETAHTRFELIARFDGLSSVRALPSTGRLHQIRATACSLGFPVVGDKIYGLDDTLYERFIAGGLTAEDERKLILKRQALHSRRLRFLHPVTGGTMELEAAVPAEMAVPR